LDQEVAAYGETPKKTSDKFMRSEDLTLSHPSKPLHSVKRFYFLEYFYVLLKSIEKYADKEQVFNSFKILKREHRLGESKYKTPALDSENLSKLQLDRYRYTFGQVIDESKEYELIVEDNNNNFSLTDEGKILLTQYREEGTVCFNQSLFKLMESRYNAFYYLIDFLYNTNKYKPGLLIFPNYSPRQLHFERPDIRTTGHFVKYSEMLVSRLQDDIQKYLGENKDLKEKNRILLSKLTKSGLLSRNFATAFSPEKYNVITKRIRDFWINYFLSEVYRYQYSMSSFDIWTYRGKQIGIIQATEFYPNFNGRIVYPTSVIMKSTESADFKKVYEYLDGLALYIHEPVGVANQEKFVDSLVKAYFDLRRSNRSYFINLSALRELVCYNMKISEQSFELFLDTIYKMNLAGELKIRISLEVDKLPEETKAMYLKQEPVMVDGKYRNIIAIDVAKEAKIT